MRILMTNHALASPGGTETFVMTTALALKAAGIDVWVYTPGYGEAAERLAAAGVPVVRDPSEAPPPDVIHGQHQAVRAACAAFPDVPRLFMAHGTVPPEEQPPDDLPFGAYLAASDGVAEHLRAAHGIEDVEIIRNGLDMAPWSALPPPQTAPTRVLLLKNVVEPAAEGALSAACGALGVAYERIVGQPAWDVVAAVGRADVVVTWGRGALEAMAAGRTTIGFGHGNLIDGAITPDNFEALRFRSFSGRVGAIPCSPDAFAAEIRRHDVAVAAAVALRVHAEHDVQTTAARLAAVYRRLADEARTDTGRP